MTVQILCGGYGGPGGQLIRHGETVDVTVEEAERLVELGAAQFVLTEGEAAAAKAEPEPIAEEPEPEVSQIPDDLSELTKKQLADVAEKLGLDTSKCRTKADMIALIQEFGEPVEEDDVVL